MTIQWYIGLSLELHLGRNLFLYMPFKGESGLEIGELLLQRKMSSLHWEWTK